MSTLDFKVYTERAVAVLDSIMADSGRRLERAFLSGTARSARRLTLDIRAAMTSANLGNLGQALADRSDNANGGIKRRYQNGGFSASAQVYVRSKSRRSRGALKAYLQGAEIRPVNGRWLWIPSDDILRVAGIGAERRRIQPSNWTKFGLDKRIGPLVLIKGSSGKPLLIVKNVGVSAAGKPRSAKSLTKRGLPRKGQSAREFVIAFTAIPRTSRAARIDVAAMHAAAMAELPQLIADAYGRF